MDMFTDVLLNAGPIGLLAAYMMYWLQKQEAKHDKLTKHYMDKIEDLQTKDETAREAMLDKYEKREDGLLYGLSMSFGVLALPLKQTLKFWLRFFSPFDETNWVRIYPIFCPACTG